MIVLRVANQSKCFYAWRHNVVVAHSVGVKDEQIAALERGDIKASCFTEAQQLAFAFTYHQPIGRLKQYPPRACSIWAQNGTSALDALTVKVTQVSGL